MLSNIVLEFNAKTIEFLRVTPTMTWRFKRFVEIINTHYEKYSSPKQSSGGFVRTYSEGGVFTRRRVHYVNRIKIIRIYCV